MRRILCSDWLPKPIRIVRFDPLASKKSHGATYKVRNFLTMSSMESPKATEDIQNKENINELEDSFPESGNKQVILDSYFSEVFPSMIMTPLLIRLGRPRWLHISLETPNPIVKNIWAKAPTLRQAQTSLRKFFILLSQVELSKRHF